MRAVTQRWMAAAVRRSVSSLGGSVRAVISGYLFCHPFGYCGERSRIFRVSDDFSVGSELGIPVGFMTKAQQRLASSADAVVCVSPVLVDTWRAQGYDAWLVPNGCDVDRLRHARDLARPADVTLPEPIVGYTGLLAHRIDIDLLRAVAERGHSLLLVGGIRPDLDPKSISDVLDRPNVRWLGHRPYAEIPKYLGAMTVGIVPYTTSAFNRASFPLKLLEYLAAGLPVVSTDLPAVRWLDTDVVQIATGADDFVAAVDASVATSADEAQRTRRLAFAATHSWASRAADYMRILQRLEQQGRPLLGSSGIGQ
jgi:glycosyltransferase involved in cell wall biosynthesis